MKLNLTVIAALFIAFSIGTWLAQKPPSTQTTSGLSDGIEGDVQEGIEGQREEAGEEESEEEIAYERAAEKLAFPGVPAFNPADLHGQSLDDYREFKKEIAISGNQFSSAEDLTAYMASAARNMTALPRPKMYSYADKRLKGTWDQKYFSMNSDDKPGYAEGGSRADGATFDPVNNVLYVVSSPGHLYKIDPKSKIKWSLRNHKKNLRGDDFNGVNLAKKSFRLLHQKDNGPMEFSDDEGRTWADANGAFFENSWNFKTLVAKRGKGRLVVAHGGRYVGPKNVGFHRIYLSTDGGLNYATSRSTGHLKISDFEVSICKPHNSKSIYCFARRKSDSKIFTYRMKESDNDFVYQGNPISLKGLGSVVGTEIKGDVHFYISFNKTDIFYSKDEGLTWKQISSTNRGGNIADVHPTKPNICFRGFTDLNMSTDYGATWTPAKHAIGPRVGNIAHSHYVWDLQFFRIFDKEKRGHVAFAGFDFGSYFSLKPEFVSSWTSINRGNPIMLSYDADTSERYDRVFLANQDRGVQSFLDNGSGDDHISTCLREANTDILRVTTAKGGSSSWFWYYYGAIGRAPAVQGGNYRAVTKRQLFPKFAATSLIPSPDPKEDAVYIPWGTQLQKISYENKRVVKTLHPYTFDEQAWSFGYSKLNTDRWFVGLRSGQVMYSSDGGKSFTQSKYSGAWPRGEKSHRKTRAVFATSPVKEATVFYAGKGSNFLVSTNGGKTFTNQNKGLKVRRVVDLAVSTDGKYIFAACDFDGAWVYSARQRRWYKMDGEDVPSLVHFTDVQYLDKTDTVRFATYGSGVLDFKIRNAR